jgi:hypothetical protein
VFVKIDGTTVRVCTDAGRSSTRTSDSHGGTAVGRQIGVGVWS